MADALQIKHLEDRFLLEVVGDIVSAYVSKNAVPLGDLPTLISDTYRSLKRLTDDVSEAPAGP